MNDRVHESKWVWLAYGSMLVGIGAYPVFFLSFILVIWLKGKESFLVKSHASYLFRTFLYAVAGYFTLLFFQSSQVAKYFVIAINLLIIFRCTYGAYFYFKKKSI